MLPTWVLKQVGSCLAYTGPMTAVPPRQHMILRGRPLRSHYPKPCQRLARSEILLVRMREVCILIVPHRGFVWVILADFEHCLVLVLRCGHVGNASSALSTCPERCWGAGQVEPSARLAGRQDRRRGLAVARRGAAREAAACRSGLRAAG